MTTPNATTAEDARKDLALIGVHLPVLHSARKDRQMWEALARVRAFINAHDGLITIACKEPGCENPAADDGPCGFTCHKHKVAES